MLRIGLTGGIGSGKSTVARIFEVLGIPVYDSDTASKKLMTENEELKKLIKNSFGEKAYTGGELNRKYLAELVFNDSTKMALLNSFVHPATINHAELWMKKQNAPYVVKEAALIFESGSQKQLDYVIGVKAPMALRLQRIVQRDHVNAEQVKARMGMQMDEEIKMRLCDYVIINDEQQMLIPQVLELHNQFLKMQGLAS
ncbi:MAG: dephospho-CoA kinase [Bacteroidota bacterium]|nr:dephospho-CoA kinase [Bacteroidota bacterium]